MTHSEKLMQLRQAMQTQGIAAYIIPSSDPHISEYLPDRYKCIAWASGFTGSAGTLVITQSFAGLWTDARYFVQAGEQLADTGFELVKLRMQGAAEYVDWLAEQLDGGAVVAFDGKLASVAIAKVVLDTLQPLGITVRGDIDLFDGLWKGRPALPREAAYLIDETTTGESSSAKLNRVKRELARKHAKTHLISSLDDVAWLLNIRGSDVQCNPVVLAFVLVTADSTTLYIDRQKLSEADGVRLAESNVLVEPYEHVEQALRILPEGTTIWMDSKRTCYSLYAAVPNKVSVLDDTNPSTNFKAIKNETEIAHMRDTMVQDGVAMTRFFKWLEERVGKEEITELSLAAKLRDFRAMGKGFVGESFSTIGGYKANGALPHYMATPESHATLMKDGLMLVDSGGQYRTGTTDITRVVSLGNATPAEQMDYTLVLKAMIEGSMTTFSYGTKGYQIDAITRRPLWEHLRNYGHGTGHGIGFFLNVHEGPHVFNASNVNVAIEPGMITSIEPGLYREGEYGIRIENLVLSKVVAENQFGAFLDFETLTLCYIDTSLVDKSILTQQHVDWLNGYHEVVYKSLAPHLSDEEQVWLAEKTKTI